MPYYGAMTTSTQNVAGPGFVNQNPEHNQQYLAQYRDDPWWEILSHTHGRLNAIIPGYTIAQIKEKFGGLCYYIDYPEGATEAQRKSADAVISHAESWAYGFEAGRRFVRKKEAGK